MPSVRNDQDACSRSLRPPGVSGGVQQNSGPVRCEQLDAVDIAEGAAAQRIVDQIRPLGDPGEARVVGVELSAELSRGDARVVGVELSTELSRLGNV